MRTQYKNRLLYRSTFNNKIGRIIESAVAIDSGWTGMPAMRILESYAVIYILEGVCRLTLGDGQEHDFVPGDLFIIFPEVPHRYGPAPGCRWSQLFVTFEGDLADLWRQKGLLDPSRFVYHLQPVDYWLGRFESMWAELPAGDPYSVQPICAFQALLAEAIESHGHSPADRETVIWLREAYRLIAKGGSSATFAVQSVAEQMGMSYANFRKKFATLARMAPGQYHTLLVMRSACQCMHEELISSKELSQRLGFCNEHHFSRRFKEIIGLSPTAYREQLGGRPAQAS